MNDVGGSDSGTGLRAGKSSRTSDANFEYDDSEWDVGIGNLIIDLDADIEKNNEANKTSTNSTSTGSNSLNHNTSNNTSTNNSPLTSGSTASSSQMHIPHVSTTSTGSPNNPSSSSVNSTGKIKSSTPNLPLESKSAPTVTSDSKDLPSSMESAIVDKGLKMKIKRTKTGTKSGADAKHEIVKSDLALATSAPTSSTLLSSGLNSNSNSNSSSGSNKSGGSGSTDSISSKSAHMSSSHKDKVKDNNICVLDGERDKPSANSSTHSGPASNTNNGVRENSTSNNDQGGKGKTPRKCSTHKKVKSGNNGSGSSKKDDRNSNPSVPKAATNSLSSGSHAKDGKDFFSTTVSLNVPSIVPSSSSLAKTTLKVPIANNSSNSLNSQHSVPLLSSIDSSSTARLSSSNSLWPSSSPSKAGDKEVSAASNSAVDKGQGSPSYGKKPRSYPAAVDKIEENVINHGTSTNSNSSYRNVLSSSDISSPSSFASIVNNQAGSAPLNLFAHTSPKGRISQGISSTQDVCIGTSVGTVTEPDCLGPCEPGTSVTLEGIVWHETESGVLVVNVTWRGKTYVGTLLDCTKNDWAPPRFCDSPTSDLEMRTPKNRGKRGRGQVATPVNEVQSDAPRGPNPKLRNGAKGRRGSASTTAFVAPASPIKSEQWPKRKTRGSENESQDEPIPKNAKRPKVSKDGDRKERQSRSPAPEEKTGGPSSPVLIECPEPNCSKKYKHINGLRYHQSHAHCSLFVPEDSDSNASTTSTQLTAPLESGVSERPISEAMEVDGICDLDGSDTISIAPEELGNPETRNTPLVGNISEAQKVEENSFHIIADNEVGDKEKLDDAESLLVINKNYIKTNRSQKEISTDNKEGEIKSLIEAPKKELSPSSIASRAPILTVPVPYISLQNRPLVHGNTVNAPRAEPVLGSRDHDSIVMKPLLMNTASTVNPSILPSKGVPWQPHAHSNPIPTMSVHSQPNISVPLNIPLSGNNDKISVKDRDKDRSFSDSHGKKSKHKKKSRDKEKDGKSRSLETRKDGGKTHGETVRIGSMFASSIPPTNPIALRGESADDLRISKRNDSIGPKNDASRHSGDNRDDPQSPAYSDISDANDSGDADMNVSVSKETCKNLVQPDLKKDSPVVGGGLTMPSYYPSFYSPYLDSNHSSKLGDKPNLCDESEKVKPVKPIPQSQSQGPPTGSIPPPSVPGNPEDNGRPAKLDFHHPKYLPHQQHFFHYPFSNYHFDQGQYNNVNPENPFAPGRSFPVEEREKERELISDHSKTKLGDKESGILNVPIKKEPSDRFKDSRQSNMGKGNPEDKQIQIKSEFGPEYGDPKPIAHFMGATCSKHSKDPKRDDPSKSDPIRSGSINEKSTKDSMESEKEMREREREREKTEGSKPTMETQGPPPPPTAGSYAYIPQPYLQGNPFGLHFDPGHPLYRQVLVPGPYGGPPYMHPGSIPRFQPPPGTTPLPEDLSRPSAQPTGPSSKALDLLQHHAAQYYSVHKIHELSERALKSPSPQVSQKEREHPSGSSAANAPASPVGLSPSNVGPNPRSTVNNSGVTSASSIPKPADLSKDSKMGPGGPINESSRSPPTQHHVHSHTHHHTHVGIGYPALIPAFPAPHSPHYGVIPTTPAAATVIPPFPSQKPN